MGVWFFECLMEIVKYFIFDYLLKLWNFIINCVCIVGFGFLFYDDIILNNVLFDLVIIWFVYGGL